MITITYDYSNNIIDSNKNNNDSKYEATISAIELPNSNLIILI